MGTESEEHDETSRSAQHRTLDRWTEVQQVATLLRRLECLDLALDIRHVAQLGILVIDAHCTLAELRPAF